jgi:hypothetical protein
VNRLLIWCHDRGIQVEFTDQISFFQPKEKLIGVNRKVGKQTQLFHLLHECGHYLVWRSRHERHKAGWGDPTLLETKLAVVDEELEAWYRGRRLAKRLGIKINARAWARCKAKNLRTYFAGT